MTDEAAEFRRYAWRPMLIGAALGAAAAVDLAFQIYSPGLLTCGARLWSRS